MLLTTVVFQYRPRTRLSRVWARVLVVTGSSTIKDLVCIKRPPWKQEEEKLSVCQALEKEAEPGMTVTITSCTSALWCCHRL